MPCTDRAKHAAGRRNVSPQSKQHAQAADDYAVNDADGVADGVDDVDDVVAAAVAAADYAYNDVAADVAEYGGKEDV